MLVRHSFSSKALYAKLRYSPELRRFPRLATSALCLLSASAFDMPSPPLRRSTDGAAFFDLEGLSSQISEQEQKRQDAYDLSRHIQVALVKARNALENNLDTTEACATLTELLENPLLSESKDRTPREANLSLRMEDYVRYSAYQHFLQTAALLPPLDNVTDEEYLAGACMGLSQDLQRYGLGRATVRDVESVQAATNLVAEIMDYLLQLDFRNGPLRRKYDGTKYSLKALETLLYELAVTGAENAEPEAKRQKQEPSNLLPMDQLAEIRKRMEHRDELRESLIKKSRDGQKAAKQSIFALHRGDKDRALQLMQECKDCIHNQLLPIVKEEPPLRGGSFGNVLEEYVEAKLFCAWLYGKDAQAAGDMNGPAGILLQPEDFDIALQPEEYLGGLGDLTGEVGRYAVQRGTARDVDGVKLCLQTNASIYTAMQALERLPQGIGKKMDAVRRSVEKLERMLYEMSLSEAAGGRNVKSDMEVVEDGE